MPKRQRKKSILSKQPAKRRRPSSPEPTTEQYFAARGILDEKYNKKGQLLYKIDWEDNPATGEKYAPTWEPAENVTADTIEAWEIRKLENRTAQLVNSSPPPDNPESNNRPASPAQPVPKRLRTQSSATPAAADESGDRPAKRARTTAGSRYTSASRSVSICVDIPAVPTIDPTQFTFIPPSQSSAIIEGVDSQRTIPDSQEDTVTQSTAAANTEAAQSQLTHQQVAEEVLQNQGPEEASQEQQAPEVSHTEIPSRQPDDLDHHYEVPSVLIERQSNSGSVRQDSSSEPHNLLIDRDESSKVSSPVGFLTQPDYDIPLQSQEVDNRVPNSPSPPSSSSSSSHFQSAAQSPSLSQQAAQFIQPLQVSFDHPSGHIRTQTPEVLQDSQDIVVPETAKRQEHQSTSGGSKSLVSGPRVPIFATGSDRNSFHISEAGSDLSLTRRAKSFENSFRIRADRTMDPPISESSWHGPDAVQELKAAIPSFNRSASTPSGLSGASNNPVSTSNPVFRDAREELRAAIPTPKFNFMHPQTENSPQPISVEPPKYRSAVDELKEGMALAREKARMNLESSTSPFRYSSQPNPNLSAQLPLIGAAHSTAFEHLPATVAPSDLTTSVDILRDVENDSHGSFTENPAFYQDAGSTVPEEVVDERRTFVVTLPMAANARSMYLSTIKEHKDAMIEFGKVFSNSLSEVPNPTVVANLNGFFDRLQALCDLPSYHTSLHTLEPKEMMKHATNSNSKYSFVYEFLMGVLDVNARILVVSQPGRAFNYLEAVVKATGHPYKVLGTPEPVAQDTSIIMADAASDLSSIHGAGIEIVILFDEAARSAQLPSNLGYESTIVLSLTAAYTLEHIEFQLRHEYPDLKGLEKKNALNLATAAIQKYLETPERGISEPHEVAEIFSKFIRNPEIGIDWEPHPLPDDVLELWRNSSQIQETQGETADLLNSRKRHRDEDTHVITKRPKTMVHSVPVPMSDLLRDCLAKHAVDEDSSAKCIAIPVAQLERLAAKIYNLETALTDRTDLCSQYRELARSQESQRLSWERTGNRLQSAYSDALNDRSKFEKECKAATEQLAASKAQVETLETKVNTLESALTKTNDALRNSSNPDVAKLVQLEKELKEERGRSQAHKDHAASMEKRAEYLRDRHQDTASEHSVLERQIKDLKTEIAQLRERDSNNALEVNRLHKKNEFDAMTRQIDEQKAIIQDMERELDRLREELKVYKSNRRETRSPRPGSIMSPRPSRGATAAAGSRGTSPALPPSSDPAAPGGMNYIGGNSSRLSHLRSE